MVDWEWMIFDGFVVFGVGDFKYLDSMLEWYFFVVYEFF